jgi:unspecific monooxygenase
MKAILNSKFSFANLLKDPKKLTEEILRYCTPLHMFTRYSSVEIKIEGHQFRAGDRIGLLLAAANRDPMCFLDPEDFNPLITRKPNLSLGAGIHFCLGAHLARLELEIAITTLIDLFPRIRIAEEPCYQDNFHFFGLKELILSIEN